MWTTGTMNFESRLWKSRTLIWQQEMSLAKLNLPLCVCISPEITVCVKTAKYLCRFFSML